MLGKSFYEAGFVVVLDDIIMGQQWYELQEDLAGVPFEFVVLAPQVEVVTLDRDLNRGKTPQGEEWAHYLDRELRETMKGIGVWVDSSKQTPQETVDEIIRAI